MTSIWWLYLLAVVLEISGLVVAAFDLRSRGRKLAAFKTPPRPKLPPMFNEVPEAAQLVASQGERVVQKQREVDNELIDAIAKQAEYADAVDRELGKLAGLGERLEFLKLAAVLVFAGAAVGGVANLLASYEG